MSLPSVVAMEHKQYRVHDTQHSIPCGEAVPLAAAIFGCNSGEFVLCPILGFSCGEPPILGWSCGELVLLADRWSWGDFFGLGCTTGGSLVASGTVGRDCCGKSGNKEDDLGGGGGIDLVVEVVSLSGVSVQFVDGGGFSPGIKTTIEKCIYHTIIIPIQLMRSLFQGYI